ncbi:MAG: cupredoxin domain-containing protein [Egibacteraceae bacterium]
MTDIRKLLAGLALLVLGAVGCGGGGGSPPAEDETTAQTEPAATETSTQDAASEASAGENTVVAESVKFEPTALTVPAGMTVTWENRETLPVGHTVTSGTPGSPSGLFDMELPQGGSVEFTFAEAGTFPFYCDIHRQMTGEITVQ